MVGECEGSEVLFLHGTKVVAEPFFDGAKALVGLSTLRLAYLIHNERKLGTHRNEDQ